MSAYYNEIDPFAAQWLRNLIAAGHIAPGDVDERDIRDIFPDDIKAYTQCHFFAGIGGWSYALRLASWPDDKPVWTGFFPCQPFSAAGKREGFTDERHLWPSWFYLIEQRKPPIIFGEQVASKAVEPWIDLVQDDLEAVDYAFGTIPFPAASVGAPHIRDRLYWVANSNDARLERRQEVRQCSDERTARPDGMVGELADPDGGNARPKRKQRSGQHGQQPANSKASALVHTEHRRPALEEQRQGAWSASDLLLCTDGKTRPVEPGTFPLAHGIPNRVGRLRAYGNAIVPQAAAEFITAYMECRP